MKSSWSLVRLVCFAALLAAPAAAQAPTIALDEAVNRARAEHPDVRTAAAEVRIAEGELRIARTYVYNPEAAVSIGRAKAADETAADRGVSLSQTVELGGKRGKRTAAATARLGSARANLEWTRQLVGLRVRRAYSLAMAARDRVKTAREAEAIATELRTAADERLRLGAGTLLEVNVAGAAKGRAVAERLAAERRLREAQAELASAVGVPGMTELEPEEGMPNLGQAVATEEELVARLMARADLSALRAQAQAAEADVRLADALGIPDVTAEVRRGREGIDRESKTTFGIVVPLPVFNRNQGGRATARAALERARTVEAGARQQAERDTRAAYRRYELGRQAVASFDREVVDRLAENLSLAWESFRAGKIGLLEFNLVRRDLVETRLAYLDALAELVDARAALEAATGAPLGLE